MIERRFRRLRDDTTSRAGLSAEEDSPCAAGRCAPELPIDGDSPLGPRRIARGRRLMQQCAGLFIFKRCAVCAGDWLGQFAVTPAARKGARGLPRTAAEKSSGRGTPSADKWSTIKLNR